MRRPFLTVNKAASYCDQTRGHDHGRSAAVGTGRPPGPDQPPDGLPRRRAGAGRGLVSLALRLTLLPEVSGFIAPRLSSGGWWSLAGAAFFGLISAAATLGRSGPAPALLALLWGAAGGLAGAFAAILRRPDASP